MQDNSGSTIWEYDLRGRLIHEAKTVIDYQDPANQQDNLSLGTYHTYWSYNSDDSARQMVYPNGETVNFAYHAQGAVSRISSIQDETEQTRDYLTSAGYDAAGRTLSRMMGSGIAQAYTYYPWTQQGGRLQAMTAQRGVENYQNLAYSYDQVGNILQINDAVANEALVFTYDDLNRLDLVSGAYSEDPVYSASNGNISTRNGVTYTYGDNAHVHAVTATTDGRSFEYDLNGNMISRVLSSSEVYQLTYDEANQLVEIQQEGSGSSWVNVGRYVYDGDGKRVLSVVDGARTVYIGGYFEAELGLQVTYPVEVPEIVSSYDHYVNKVYFPVVFGNGSAGLGMPVGNFGNTYYHTHPSPTGQSWITWRMYYSVGSATIAMRKQGNSESYELHYMLTDHLGGTVKTIRQDGLISELRYSAWGETRWSSGTMPTEKQYTGQYKAEAGLYFYQSRFYDGSLGRFISPDTLVPDPNLPISWDRYAYAKNNSVNYSDPTGHFPWIIAAIPLAGWIVGAASYQIRNETFWWSSPEAFQGTIETGVEGAMAAMAMAVGISEVYLIAQQAEPFVSAASRSLRPSSNTLNSGRNLISETENYPPGTF